METLQTGAGPLRVVRAADADCDAVVAVLKAAAEWVRTKGIVQWDFFATPRGAEYIRWRIANHDVYLFRDATGADVGTVCLQWEDEKHWGEPGSDGLAGYVHGLAIVREVDGKGVGAAILRWAEARTAAAGRPLVRLDCMAGNPGLNSYYERQGFRKIGERDMGGWLTILFEKTVGIAAVSDRGMT